MFTSGVGKQHLCKHHRACMHARKLIACIDACKQVSVKGKLKGVVKFVGATTFGPGVWVGVELDKPKGESPLTPSAALDSARSLQDEPNGAFARA